ncbi:MAG: glycosyltransferase family 4 protein [Verrucomicrobia bacterium]|nr:glycosyltransferase family 4 protein [Verrucomicrobiota bacterium]
MRVCHVITRLIVGGAQENTLASVVGLRRLPGYECVDLISGAEAGAEGSLLEQARQAGVEPIWLKALRRSINPSHDARAFVELTRLLRRGCYDVVHTHSGKAGFLGRLAARAVGVPVVVHTIHGPSFGPFQGAMANAALRLAEQIAGRVTTRFVSVADAMSRLYLDAGIGRAEDYVTIRSGFDVDAFARATPDVEFRARLGGGPIVGQMARLFELKGWESFFEMARALPEAKFLLVGDGPWRAKLEAWAAEPGLRGRVHFAGLVPPAEVPRWVASMDALVHLSLREGLPRAVVQALAAGKPVVAHPLDGTPEVVVDGESGFLIPAGDGAALTERVRRLLRDPALASSMGRCGQARALKEFGVETMVRRLDELYRSLIPTCNRG